MQAVLINKEKSNELKRIMPFFISHL